MLRFILVSAFIALCGALSVHERRSVRDQSMQMAIAGAALGPSLYKQIFGGSDRGTSAKDRVMGAMAAVAVGRLFQPKFDRPSFCENNYVRLATTVMSEYKLARVARMLEIFGCTFGGTKAMIEHNEVVSERKRDRMLGKIKQIFTSVDHE